LAWPRIVALGLHNPVHSTNKSSQLTLMGLLAFAQHCPHLRILRVQIDARDAQEVSPNKVVFNKMLTALHISYSPINDSPSVAAFLSRVFLTLKAVEVEDNSEFRDKWELVQRLLGPFRTIRQEERMLARERTSTTELPVVDT
jgi:hypothetical protein